MKKTVRFGVPYLLSFAGSGKPYDFKMGRGEAGWTVAYFETCEAAQAFADSIPLCSRVPNHGVAGGK